ncbi:helix-turn-helix transcriptional regulator [Variovorax sp. LARHSF232]
MNSSELTKYPAGAYVRVRQICTDSKTGRPGLLPVVSRTWLKWVEQGRAPAGILLSPRTRAWKIEDVLAFAAKEQ